MATTAQPIQAQQAPPQPDVVGQAIAKSLGNVAQHQTQAPDHAPDVIDTAISKSLGLPDPNAPTHEQQVQQSVRQSRSQTKGKALVPVMGEPRMMFTDVPEGQEASTEKSSDRGQAIGEAIGAGGTALAAGGTALAAPSATTETVGTGILDTAGEEIMREGIKYGPSAIAKALSSPIGKEILHWAVKGGAGAVGGAGVWKALKALGLL